MISGRRSICIILLALLAITLCYSQAETQRKEENTGDIYDLARRILDAEKQLEENYAHIYNEAVEKHNAKSQLLTGKYYENPYYNAKGHPFLTDGDFHTGSVIYRNRNFEGIRMRYDIFHQQIIINPDIKDPMLMILLSNEFISGFRLGGEQFRKIQNDSPGTRYYQVVCEEDLIQCYRLFYKSRYKNYREEGRVSYSFSENNQSDYLRINGTLNRYRNNRTFIGLFPDEMKPRIRDFMKSQGIRVNSTDKETMKKVIVFSQGLFGQL